MYWLRIAAWLLALVYCTIPAFWLVAHPNARRWKSPRRAFRVLLPSWLFFILLAGAITWPWHEIVLFQSPFSILLGVIFLLVGAGIYRRSGAHFTWKQLSGAPEFESHKAEEQRLITSGMHARVRHPIYLAHLINVCGWTLISGLEVLLWLLLFAIATGWLMVRLEEEEMQGRFGEAYREYQRRVPAIMPKFFA